LEFAVSLRSVVFALKLFERSHQRLWDVPSAIDAKTAFDGGFAGSVALYDCRSCHLLREPLRLTNGSDEGFNFCGIFLARF